MGLHSLRVHASSVSYSQPSHYYADTMTLLTQFAQVCLTFSERFKQLDKRQVNAPKEATL